MPHDRQFGEGVWPSEAQQLLLGASFLPPEKAAAQFAHWQAQCPVTASSGHAEEALDEPSLRLLPLVRRNLGDALIDPALAALAQRVHLTTWQQNREKSALAASLSDTLRATGVDCLFLKGIALLLRHYRDTGLRNMSDVDFLVRAEHVPAAIQALRGAGWLAEDGFSDEEILAQRRVRHAWQFDRPRPPAAGESCDLHWRPILRCYTPEITTRFWKDAEAVDLHGRAVLVPSAACQLLHVCLHGVQWSWLPQIRWIADALMILKTSPSLDWSAVLDLATAAQRTVQLYAALDYLVALCDAPIPVAVLEALSGSPAATWERREYAILQKQCPLGFRDSATWHLTNFQRIREHDSAWRQRSRPIAFLDYLAVFLNARGSQNLAAALWREGQARTQSNAPR